MATNPTNKEWDICAPFLTFFKEVSVKLSIEKNQMLVLQSKHQNIFACLSKARMTWKCYGTVKIKTHSFAICVLIEACSPLIKR